MSTTIVPYLNENGKPYQYVAIRFDITKQKKQEIDLKGRTQQLEDFCFIVSHSAIVVGGINFFMFIIFVYGYFDTYKQKEVKPLLEEMIFNTKSDFLFVFLRQNATYKRYS